MRRLDVKVDAKGRATHREWAVPKRAGISRGITHPSYKDTHRGMAEAAGEDKSARVATAVGSEAVAKDTPEASSSSPHLTDSNDPLATALHSLFTSFTDVVQGELQCSNSEYELLNDMNLRTASEYDNFGDFASGMRIFVERLKHKNETFNQYLRDIDGIDHQVTELEALVSTLDTYTNTLHTQIRNAFADT